MIEALHTAVLVALLGAAAWSDLRTRRIPNSLTVSGLAAGMALAVLAPGGSLAGSALAVAVAFAMGFLLFVGRVLGGGDVKLLIAVAALLGMERFAVALLLTALAGAVLALGTAVRRGVLLPALFNSKDTLVSWATLGRAGAAPALSTGVSVPYGVAIAAGALGAWFV